MPIVALPAQLYTTVAESLRTYQLGTARPLGIIQAQLQAHFDRELSLHLPQLTTPLLTRYPHAQVVPEPQLAVARGYARFAHRKLREDAR